MFRFSIRELMLVTLVVAIGLGWRAHWQLLERRNAKRSEYIGRLKDELGLSIGKADAFEEALGRSQHGFEVKYLIAPLPDDVKNEP